MAILVTWPSHRVMRQTHLFIALPVLLLIVLVGVVFDIIGVAVAVADEAPFHAMSSKRIPGARHSLRLIRNADRVASISNDIVGDLSGTISGAAGAAIVIRLAAAYPGLSEALLSVLTVGLIAALTVGGKGAGKAYAIREAERITFRVGRLLYWLERYAGLRILGAGRRRGGSNSRRRREGR